MLITATSTKSEIDIDFRPEIDLSSTERKIAFYSIETSNSIPNITESNNAYEVVKGTDKKICKIPTGNYSFRAIARHIQADSGARLQPNEATGHSVIEIPDGVVLNLNIDNSIADVLGFERVALKHTDQLQSGENMIKISTVNSIFISCDVVTGSWDNGNLANTLFKFYPDVPAGAKIVKEARQIMYLPFIDSRKERLSRMKIRITDQDMNLIDFRGEPITITLFLK